MKKGTRVTVNEKNAKAWGYKTPATGTVIGGDPRQMNVDCVSVKLDQTEDDDTPSIYEWKGVHIGNLTEIKDGKATKKKTTKKNKSKRKKTKSNAKSPQRKTNKE